MKDVFEIIYKYREAFGSGLLVTLNLCLITWITGLIVGGALGILSVKWKRAIGIPVKAFSFFLSGIPILVFLYWLHYPAQTLLHIVVKPFYTAATMLTILNIFAVSDIVRNGIENLPNQYIEVAKICGLNNKKRLFKIELPLIFRHIFPPLLITQVNMLHISLFASLISVEEIFRVTQRVISIEYKPVEIYTALGIFFLLISLPLN
jgi:polar amino acid transport system permease protein